MLIVGLTGGYASGKSTVTRMFEELGATIIDADILARKVVEQAKPAWSEIVSHFGEGILLENREIDRKALGEIIFSDEKAREKLNEIVHPKVLDEELKSIEETGKRTPDAVVVLSVPLLIESGHYRHCNRIVVVTVDEKIHIQRLMKRDGFNRDEAIRRISTQMPLSEKVKYADFVIDNSRSIRETGEQVRNVYANLVKSRA